MSSYFPPPRSGAALVRGGQHHHLVLPGRGRADGLDHLPDELGADLGHGLVLRQGHVGEQGRVADDAGLGVAVDVRLPLPARRVRVPGADVLGLEPLELLLGAELVGLCRWGTWLVLVVLVATMGIVVWGEGTYHLDCFECVVVRLEES